ncbi:relaxase [Morganella morganii]|uniref:Relaxase n=1 Tax=Morganella morganii TaxID=582 RepID=A0A433ZPP2_MORMO|nr:TraI domain-containing protein [Morganella morganii]RUT64093.1 relaxase [Morganella morganii]
MLKAIRELLVGTREVPARNNASSQPTGPEGYFMPQSATQLLDMPARKQCLQQLWENNALPKDLYEQFYLQPLHKLVTLMQVLPATRQGEYAREGGLVDITLQTTTYAVRLAKGHMLPPGAAPEEQSAQNILWNAVVFYAAIWRYLPLLSQIEGELLSGQPWLPGVTAPTEPYRFRFRPAVPDPTMTMSQSALVACRLLPAEVVSWLSTLPAAAQALMLIASGRPSSLPVIGDIVQEAVRLSRGEGIDMNVPGPVNAAIPVPPVPSAMPSELQSAASPKVELGASSPGGDLHSAVTGEQVPGNPDAASHDAGAAVTPEEGIPVLPGDILLSSALDTPVNELPLAEMVVAPEPVIKAEEDMQALLSLMNVSVVVPANQVEQEQEVLPKNGSPLSEPDLAPAQDISTVIEEGCDLPEQNYLSVSEPELSGEAGHTSMQHGPPGHKEQEIAVTAELLISVPVAEDNIGETFWHWLCAGIKGGRIPVNQKGARAHMVSGFVFLCVPEIFHLYIKECGKARSDRNGVQKAFEKTGRHRVRKGQRFFIGHLYQEPAGYGPYRRINGYLVKANSLYGGRNVPEDSPFLVIP